MLCSNFIKKKDVDYLNVNFSGIFKGLFLAFHFGFLSKLFYFLVSY